MYSYELQQNARIRRLSIRLHADGRMKVHAPPHISQDRIDRFVKDHASWIQTTKDKLKERQKIRDEQREKHTIKIGNILKELGIEACTLPATTQRHYKAHRTTAQALIGARVAHLIEHFRTNHAMIFSPQRICVKNLTTRWGSCSSHRNLNFNYRIIFFPAMLRDYVIVHELCHLIEMNHSKKFWDLVAKEFPQYRKINFLLKNLNE